MKEKLEIKKQAKIKAKDPEKLESIEQEKLLIKIKKDLDREDSRSISIKEGSFASIAQGTGHSYISPFAIALGASNAQIGILSSLPQIIAPLAQLFGSKLIEKRSRKQIVREHVFFEAMIWLLILILALLAYFGVITQLPLMLIIIYSFLVFVGGLSGPAWFSWMGDIVSEKIRGEYFAKRYRITGAVALISMLLASFFLDYLKTKGLVLIGFSILFLIANLARLNSFKLFKKQYEPELKLKDGYYVSLFSFIKNLPKHNFGRFVIFVSILKLSVFIAAPFFAVYMLRNLGFSYLWFTAITISSTIFTLIFFPLWGRFSDEYGNMITLRIGSALVPLIPLLWIVSKNPIYLALVPGMISGIGWAAFNLSSNNFIYDSTDQQRRGIYLAYFNVLAGVGIIIGGLLGSFLTQYLTIQFMNKILFVFLLSGIARALTVLLIIPRIKEPRKVKKPKKLVKAIFKEMYPLRRHQAINTEPIHFRHSFPIKFEIKS